MKIGLILVGILILVSIIKIRRMLLFRAFEKRENKRKMRGKKWNQ